MAANVIETKFGTTVYSGLWKLPVAAEVLTSGITPPTVTDIPPEADRAFGDVSAGSGPGVGVSGYSGTTGTSYPPVDLSEYKGIFRYKYNNDPLGPSSQRIYCRGFTEKSLITIEFTTPTNYSGQVIQTYDGGKAPRLDISMSYQPGDFTANAIGRSLKTGNSTSVLFNTMNTGPVYVPPNKTIYFNYRGADRTKINGSYTLVIDLYSTFN